MTKSKPEGADDAQAYLDRLRDDPVFFVRELWADRKLDKKDPIDFPWDDIIHFALTGSAGPGGSREKPDNFQRLRGVLAPRGAGKTYKLTCAGACWHLYRDPDVRIKIISRSSTFAEQAVRMIRQWIEDVWFLQHLSPSFGSDRHRDQTKDFDVAPASVTKDPSVSARGIDGQITGTRAHIVFADDIETKDNVRTVESRQRLKDDTNEFTSIASYSAFSEDTDAGGEVVIIGTIWHEETVYSEFEQRGYAMRTYPLCAPQADDAFIGLAPVIQDRLRSGDMDYTTDGHYELHRIFPYMSESGVLTNMASGRTYFGRQFMLLKNAAGEGGYPLRLMDLIVPDFDFDHSGAPTEIKWGRTGPGGKSLIWDDLEMLGFTGDYLLKPFHIGAQLAPFTDTVMVVDFSGRGSDETAYAVASFLAGNVWVHDVAGVWIEDPEGPKQVGNARYKSGSDAAVMLHILEKARQYRVNTIYVEPYFGLSMAVQLLQSQLPKVAIPEGASKAIPEGWTCHIEELKHDRRFKEERIADALEPVMGSHRLVMHPRCLSTILDSVGSTDIEYNLQYQLTRLTRVKGALPHDDRLDCLATAVERFAEFMDANQELAVSLLAEREREEMIDRWHRERGEDKAAQHTWVQHR